MTEFEVRNSLLQEEIKKLQQELHQYRSVCLSLFVVYHVVTIVAIGYDLLK